MSKLPFWVLLGTITLCSARGVTVSQYEYGSKPLQNLDLYKVEGTHKKNPLLVFIHGGAWITGDKSDFKYLGQNFVAAGIECAVINYRLAQEGNGVHHPDAVEDAALAVTWLRSHAKELNFDPDQIFIMGHSAGAHTTALLGLNPHYFKEANSLAGFIGLEGIYDIPALVKKFPSYRQWFIDLAFSSDPKHWPGDSPQFAKQNVKKPWLLVHSRGDELVDIAQTRAFYEKLKIGMTDVNYLLVEGKNHGQVVTELANPNDPVGHAVVKFIYSARH